MKKFKKLISTVTLVAFCTLSYSPAFASVAAEQSVMDEYAPQEIAEIIVKDPETKAWLESEESPYSDIPVTLVDEFPADIEAEFDAMLSSADEVEAAAVPEDGIEPASTSISSGSLQSWLPGSVYNALSLAGLIVVYLGMELARAQDLVDEIRKNDSPEYYATNFTGYVVYVGDAISLSVATNILAKSVALGHNGTGPDSWKQKGNVMCKNNNAALGLCSYYQATTLGTVGQMEDAHGDGQCGFYPHYHVAASGQNPALNQYHSAHVWFMN